MKRNDLEFYDRHAAHWWNENATIYALSYLNEPRFRFFDRYISDWHGLKVLDIGCGGGFSCEFMARRGAIVSGIDQSALCIEAAQLHASDHQFNIDYRVGLAEALPYSDNTFDAVTCVDVLEHVADVNQVIAEIHRILKPNGFFFFDTINRTWLSKVVMIWLMENALGLIEKGVHDWQKFMKPSELNQLMAESGFQKIIFQGFDLFSFANYLKYQKTGRFDVSLNQNTSIMYIGKSNKAAN